MCTKTFELVLKSRSVLELISRTFELVLKSRRILVLNSRTVMVLKPRSVPGFLNLVLVLKSRSVPLSCACNQIDKCTNSFALIYFFLLRTETPPQSHH